MGMRGNGNVITGMGKILKTRWEWDGNGNVIVGMGGNGMKKGVPAHL